MMEMDRENLQTKEKTGHKTCVIDVGGGLRGVYASGVLDRLIDEQIEADLCIGVSAGAANLANYLGKQKGRTYTYYHGYPYRKEYLSVHNLLKKGSLFDMDYIYTDLSSLDGEYPLNNMRLQQSRSELITVVTNALTGRPVYFDKSWMSQDHYDIIKATCAVPYICHPWKVRGIPFCDGTVSDPIPVEKALELGADRIVILFPRKPEVIEENKTKDLGMSMVSKISYGRRHPAVVEALKRRRDVNNRSFELAMKLQEEGKVLFICPETLYDVESLGASRDQIDRLYEEGYKDGAKAVAFLSGRDADESAGQ